MKAKRVAVNYLTKRPIVSWANVCQLSNHPPVVPPVTLLGGTRYILWLWRRHWLQALLILLLLPVYLLCKTYVGAKVSFPCHSKL